MVSVIDLITIGVFFNKNLKNKKPLLEKSIYEKGFVDTALGGFFDTEIVAVQISYLIR